MSQVGLYYPEVFYADPHIKAQKPIEGKKCKKGPTEIFVFAKIAELGFIDKFSQTCSLKCGKSRYEPDLTYIDEKRGIYIDIEIDEPYSARGIPTHYLGSSSDAKRNEKISAAGWTIIRFSEKQMFCQTAACIKQIYKELIKIGADITMPSSLSKVEELIPEKKWSYDQSLYLARTKIRNEYLHFDPGKYGIKDIFTFLRLSIPIVKQSFLHRKVLVSLFMELSILKKKAYGKL